MAYRHPDPVTAPRRAQEWLILLCFMLGAAALNVVCDIALATLVQTVFPARSAGAPVPAPVAKRSAKAPPVKNIHPDNCAGWWRDGSNFVHFCPSGRCYWYWRDEWWVGTWRYEADKGLVRALTYLYDFNERKAGGSLNNWTCSLPSRRSLADTMSSLDWCGLADVIPEVPAELVTYPLPKKEG